MQNENDDSNIPSERQSFLKLTTDIAKLPLEQSAALLEIGAAIAAISLRAGSEFLREVPQAARVLNAAELREWGELGRRLAMSDVETAISFFTAGVADLETLAPETRASLFQLCARQLGLSTPIAVETFRTAPALANSFSDATLFTAVLEVASDIARRSARHSADFLNQTPEVVKRLEAFAEPDVLQRAIEMAAGFASRAGGIAADAWGSLPQALEQLNKDEVTRLLDQTMVFLERGGGAALQLLVVGGEILRLLPEVFDEWLELLAAVAQHGNASLVAFVRSSPRFVRILVSHTEHERAVELAVRVIRVTRSIAATDSEAALAGFRSSAVALRNVTIEQFEEWARLGLSSTRKDARARRSYFALETRGSHDALRSGNQGLALESVSHVLRLYVEGLTGNEVEISSLAAVPVEARIGDGRTIHLPAVVAEFGDDELDFCLYKVLAAHAAGQIEFGTYERRLCSREC